MHVLWETASMTVDASKATKRALLCDWIRATVPIDAARIIALQAVVTNNLAGDSTQNLELRASDGVVVAMVAIVGRAAIWMKVVFVT